MDVGEDTEVTELKWKATELPVGRRPPWSFPDYKIMIMPTKKSPITEKSCGVSHHKLHRAVRVHTINLFLPLHMFLGPNIHNVVGKKQKGAWSHYDTLKV